MKPEHRSALVALAPRRGQKEFSAILGDWTLLAVAGSLSPGEVDQLRRAVWELASWR